MIAALRKDERWARESHPEHAQALYEMELLYSDQYRAETGEPVLAGE
jgi:hypothetical protein